MRPPRLPPNLWLPLAGAILFLLGWLEAHTPLTLTFSSFFFLPVAIAAWSGGKGWGYTFAGLTSLAWLVADLAMGHANQEQTLTRTISLLNHCLAYGAAAWMVDGLHRALDQLQVSNANLQLALAEVTRLQDLLPVCAWCRKVRNDQGLWEGVEAYLLAKGTPITHGICPQCRDYIREADSPLALDPSGRPGDLPPLDSR